VSQAPTRNPCYLFGLWCQHFRGVGEPVVHRGPQPAEQVELLILSRNRAAIELDDLVAELDRAGVAQHDRHGVVRHRQLELARGGPDPT